MLGSLIFHNYYFNNANINCYNHFYYTIDINKKITIIVTKIAQGLCVEYRIKICSYFST